MNKVRGEQTLTVGEVSYTLTPTHEALARVEGRLDVGLLELGQRFLRAKPRHTDMAVIIHECSRAAGGKELPYPQAFDFALMDTSKATQIAAALILERFGPPEPESGKAQATGN